MNVFNRAFVSLIALLMLLIGVLILLVVTGTLNPESITWGWLAQQLPAETEGSARWIAIAIAVALIVAGLALLFLELVWPLIAEPKMLLLSHGPQGSVWVSRYSIRELAERTARSNPSVEQVRCKIQTSPSGLLVRCAARLIMGSDVPTISTQLQNAIKQELEQSIGLSVADVVVNSSYSRMGERALLAR